MKITASPHREGPVEYCKLCGSQKRPKEACPSKLCLMLNEKSKDLKKKNKKK